MFAASNNLSVLMVEDSPSDADLIRESLETRTPLSVHCTQAPTLSGALGLLAKDPFDAVLLDLGLPDAAGLDALERILMGAPQLPVVVLTGRDDPDLAIEAIQRGAEEYVIKDRVLSNHGNLSRIVRYAVARHQTRAHEPQEQTAPPASQGRLPTLSPARILEDMLLPPVPVEEADDWLEQLLLALSRIRPEFKKRTDGDEGKAYTDLVRSAPRLQHRVEALRQKGQNLMDQFDFFCSAVAELTARRRAGDPENCDFFEGQLAALIRTGLVLCLQFRQHQAAFRYFSIEALTRDLGGEH